MAGKIGQRQFGFVRKLPSGRWQASYLGPDGKRRSAETTFTTKSDAGAWLSTVQTRIVEGDWRAPEPGRETFGSYGTRWLASRVDLRPSSAERYERLWRIYLEPAFGSMPLAKITVETVRTWFAKLQKKHPGSTAPGAAYRLGKAIANTAIDDGLLRVNPFRIKGAGQQESPERPIAMPAEVLKIVSHLDEPYRPMALLAAWASLRFGELAGLRRARVDLLHRIIDVQENAVELSSGKTIFGPPKTDAGRRQVAIPEELVPLLEAHLSRYVGPERDALVFTSPEGHPLRRTKFRSRWIASCEKAGVTGLHFHDLRGSGATWAAQAGATLAELMARLGHTTAVMALRYQHSTKERDRAIADKLGTLFASAEAEPVAEVRPIGGGAR